jgi:hypothetical protein
VTDAQELILDGLMGAATLDGKRPSGVLGVAVQALTGRRLRDAGEAARVLGYPRILCEALHSAAATLNTRDERRKLGVSFFSECPPRRRLVRLSPRRHAEMALWCARRVHPLLCRADCPFAAFVTRQVEGCLRGELPPRFSGTGTPPACPAAHARESNQDGWYRSPEHDAWWALNIAQNLSACTRSDLPYRPAYLSMLAGQRSARVAARLRGVSGALEFCLTLAEALRLEP